MNNNDKAKPILFNTEMVKAILEGKKTVTRRLIKYDGKGSWEAFNNVRERDESATIPCYLNREVSIDDKSRNIIYPAYDVGDVLYVREAYENYKDGYRYKAGCILKDFDLYPRWHPSIHMPKEAARLWLEVTEVSIERLQEITEDGAISEGCLSTAELTDGGKNYIGGFARERFRDLWNGTINKKSLGEYGWKANPWVWVIEFKILEPVLEKGEKQC